jgi:hypothetical protein
VNTSVLPYFQAFRKVESARADPRSVRAANRAFVTWLDAKDAVTHSLDAYFPRDAALRSSWKELNTSRQGAGVVVTDDESSPFFRAYVIGQFFPHERSRLHGLAGCFEKCARRPEWFKSFLRLENLLHERKQQVIAALLRAHSAL